MSVLIHPFVPHISEEIAVQINGKTRSVISVNQSFSKDEVIKEANKDKKVQKYVKNKNILKYIYVPEKILNIVLENETS